MKLYVNYSARCVEDYWDGEPYGNWYKEYDFRIYGINLNTDYGREEEFDVPFDVKAGDEVHVLYMIYSSGDSFGRSEGEHEIVWIFKDLEVARKAKAVYEKTVTDETDRNNSMVEIEIDDGTKLKLSNPAWGYFENVSSVHIETFIVEE